MDGRLATCVCQRVTLMRSLGACAARVAAIGAQSREPARAGPASHCASRVWAVVVLFVRFFCAWSSWRTSTARPSSLVSTARIRDQLSRRRDHSVSPSRRTTASTPLSRLIWSGVDAVVRRVSACLLHACMLTGDRRNYGEIAEKLPDCDTYLDLLLLETATV